MSGTHQFRAVGPFVEKLAYERDHRCIFALGQVVWIYIEDNILKEVLKP